MTEITPQQMIEYLDEQMPKLERMAKYHYPEHKALPIIKAIRQFIASHQEVRDAALSDISKSIEKITDALKDKP